MPITSPSRKLEGIQVGRAVAALLVVCVHAIDLVKFRHNRHGDALGLLSDGRFYSDFGASGVDFFFVISGFVMAMVIMRSERIDWRAFLNDRWVRIVPLYWLLTLIFAIIRLALGADFDLGNVAMSIAMWPLCTPQRFMQPILFVGWTLAFELAFYCALVPAALLSRSRRLLIAALTVAALAAAGTAWLPEPDLLALFINPMWFEFLLGITVYALWSRGVNRAAGKGVGLLGLALLGAGIPVHVIPDVRHFAIFDQGVGLSRTLVWGVPYAMILIGLLSLASDGGVRGHIWRGLMKIGDASYSLYLIHMLLFLPTEYLMPKGWVAPDLLPFMAVSLAVVASLSCYRWIEQPLLAWFRQAGRPLTPPARPAPSVPFR